MLTTHDFADALLAQALTLLEGWEEKALTGSQKREALLIAETLINIAQAMSPTPIEEHEEAQEPTAVNE
jgi:hypothetical protein